MSRILGPGSLSIGQAGTIRQFAGEMSKASVTPSTNSEDDIPLLDGTDESGEDTTTWELGGTVLDSYTATSLFKWCADNAGKELPFSFTPNNDDDLVVSGTVKVRPIALGGEVKKKNSNDFTFPIIGDPTITVT